MGKRMKWGWLVLIAGLMPAAGCLQFHPRDSGDATGKIDGEASRSLSNAKVLGSPTTKEEHSRLFLETARQLEKADPEHAITYYEKARDYDPRCAPAATKRLAVLYDMVDKFDKALVEYQLALQQSPRDADLWNDLGYGYYNRGNWKQAEEALRKAVAINPKHPRAWTNLGMATAQQGRIDESLSHFQKVIGKPQAYCNLAFILAAQGRKHEARTAYLEALNLEPGLQIARVALIKLDEVDIHRQPGQSAKQTASKSEKVSTPIRGSEEESTAEPFEAAYRQTLPPSTAPARHRSGFHQAHSLPLATHTQPAGPEDDETVEPELLNPNMPSANVTMAQRGLTNSPR